MPKSKSKHQGRKTVEQQRRMLESKPDLPRRDAQGNLAEEPQRQSRGIKRSARQSEFVVSRRGMNQESRHHKPEPDT